MQINGKKEERLGWREGDKVPIEVLLFSELPFYL